MQGGSAGGGGAAAHWEQQWSNSCVAACICMVRRARGHAIGPEDEAALHHEAGRHGQPLTEVPRLLPGSQWHVLDERELLREAPLWLALGSVVIIKVSGPVYVKHLGTEPGGAASRHGALAKAGDAGRPFHAIMLFERTANGFWALDPYYPAAGQPLELTNDVLLEVFACEAVVAELRLLSAVPSR